MKTKKITDLVRCFKCFNNFSLKYVRPKKAYSHKNNLDFWTEEKEDEEKHICDKCLKELYHNKKEYWRIVTNLKKRALLTIYINRNLIT